jgi:hypothetical protein
MTREFRDRGLIVDDDVSHYDGTTAVVRTAHVPAEEVEFLRWRAERWMKVRHIPAAFRHSPGFVLASARRMLAHTFTGTTWRSMMGLEPARAVFARYRAARRREREAIVRSLPPASEAKTPGTAGVIAWPAPSVAAPIRTPAAASSSVR